MGNFLNKLSSAISSETLGEVDEFGQPLPKKKEKKVKEKKSSKIESKKQIKVPVTTAKEVDKIPPQEIIIPSIPVDVTTPKGKYPVLKFLHIDLEPKLNTLITPDDISNVEFSVTAPTGLNADEIEQFCDTVQRDVGDYIKIINKRQEDFMKLLEHCQDLSQQIVEQKQESELASFIIERQSVEDKLKEQLVDLRLENAELKKEIDKLTQTTKKNSTLKQNIDLPDVDIIISKDKSTGSSENSSVKKEEDIKKPIKRFSLEEQIEDFMSIDEDPFDNILESLK